jgi:hypothetical protein
MICVLVNELTVSALPLKSTVGPVFAGSKAEPERVTWFVE